MENDRKNMAIYPFILQFVFVISLYFVFVDRMKDFFLCVCVCEKGKFLIAGR